MFVFLVVEEIEKAGDLDALNEFVANLVYVFEKHKRAIELINLFVSREIRSKGFLLFLPFLFFCYSKMDDNNIALFGDPERTGTLEASTLFRGDNAGAKSFNTYSKIVGTGYLFDTLAPFLHEVSVF